MIENPFPHRPPTGLFRDALAAGENVNELAVAFTKHTGLVVPKRLVDVAARRFQNGDPMVDGRVTDFPWADLVVPVDSPEGPIFAPVTQGINWLIDKNFPGESDVWRAEITREVSFVLSILDGSAGTQGDVNEAKVATLTGSMVRTLFVPPITPPGHKDKTFAQGVIDKAKSKIDPQEHEQVARVLGGTGIYDMDIRVESQNQVYDLFEALKRNDNCQQLKLTRLQRGTKTILRVEVWPENGPGFSIDVGPKTKEEEVSRDYKAGPHVPNKGSIPSLDIVRMSESEGPSVVYGVRQDPNTLLDTLSLCRGHVLIEKPVFDSTAQAKAMIAQSIRIETLAPNFWELVSRSTRESHGLATSYLTLLDQFEQAVTVNYDSRNDIRRECFARDLLVGLITDPGKFVAMLKSTNFGIYIGAIELIDYIERVGPDIFQKTLSESPEMIIDLVEQFLGNKRRDIIPDTPMSAEERGGCVNYAHRVTADAIPAKYWQEPESPIPDFLNPVYISWDHHQEIEIPGLQARVGEVVGSLVTMALPRREGLIWIPTRRIELPKNIFENLATGIRDPDELEICGKYDETFGFHNMQYKAMAEITRRSPPINDRFYMCRLPPRPTPPAILQVLRGEGGGLRARFVHPHFVHPSEAVRIIQSRFTSA